MLVYGLDRHLEQLGDEALRQPDGLALQADLHPRGPILIDQELAVRRHRNGMVRSIRHR